MLTPHQTDEQLMLKLDGELTIYEARNLFEQLTPFVSHSEKIAIELSQVTALDSSCIQVLMAFKKARIEQGCELIHHSEVVVDVLGKLGLVGWFHDPIVLSSSQ